MLSWNEIRNRAVKFSREWEEETREAEYASFWNDFFEVFGMKRRTVARYQEHVKRLKGNSGFIDLFWPGTLIIEHKSTGQNLDSAYDQAGSYFDALPEEQKPRYIVVSDYKRIRLYDFEGERGIERMDFALPDLSKHIRLFAFIAGYQVRTYREESPITIRAVGAIGKLYDALRESHYPADAVSALLTRLVFCFFADDTGIFNRDSFKTYLEDKTARDGSDIGYHLGAIFEILNTPVEKRQTTIDEDLAALPYVNGGLFAEHLPAVFGTTAIREMLLRCVTFDWSGISPAIFGSMFQSVMSEKARHDLGAHYTSERNILKVISGLFLDDLQKELNQAGSNHAKLDALWGKISKISILDPACGCGNFLVIAYRELRKIELEILKRKYPQHAENIKGGQGTLDGIDVRQLSKLSVEKMFGIEIESFPAAIAQLSLWLVDHIANIELGDYFGEPFARLPLTEQPHIVQGNALRLNWEEVVPKSSLGYILGNPPFLGHHLQTQEQKEELRTTLHNLPTVGVMDYVSAWYVKAAEYIQGTQISCAFVSTNSISQGEQVGILWGDLLLPLGIKIYFAHRTFRWANEAPGQAAVFCVIIGFGLVPKENPVLYEYEDIRGEPHEIKVSRINPYLVDGPDIVIRNRTKPMCDVPSMRYGNKATDGGNFILSQSEKDVFLAQEPASEKFIRRYIGAEDFLNGGERWCLWLVDADPEELRNLPHILHRVGLVKTFRSLSRAKITRDYAYSSLFRQVTQPNEDYILVPRVSSEIRKYIPMGFFSKENIISDSCQAIPGGSLYHFGVLESEMHMTWMRAVAGRLEMRYRYSKDIVYNNFPWPENPSEEQKLAVEKAAQAVLDTRKLFPNATLADLYNPETMPKVLLDAHHALDRAVDACYGRRSFKTESERMEFLFKLYEKYLEKEKAPSSGAQ